MALSQRLPRENEVTHEKPLSLQRDLNPGPSEHEGVLTTVFRRSV